MTIYEEIQSKPELSYLKFEEVSNLTNDFDSFFNSFDMVNRNESIIGQLLPTVETYKSTYSNILIDISKTQWAEVKNSNILLQKKAAILTRLISLRKDIIGNSPILLSASAYQKINSKGIDIINEKENLLKQIETYKSEIQEKVSKFNEFEKEVQNEGKKAIEKANELLEEARRTLKGKLAVQYKKQFEIKAKKFNDIANIWKITTFFSIGLLIIIFAGISWLEYNFQEKIKNIIISVNVSKVGIISILAWLVFFFNRNYSNNRNLSYIFEQKHVMLETYIAFIDTIEDKEIKDKIAAELGKIIFEVSYNRKLCIGINILKKMAYPL